MNSAAIIDFLRPEPQLRLKTHHSEPASLPDFENFNSNCLTIKFKNLEPQPLEQGLDPVLPMVLSLQVGS